MRSVVGLGCTAAVIRHASSIASRLVRPFTRIYVVRWLGRATATSLLARTREMDQGSEYVIYRFEYVMSSGSPPSLYHNCPPWRFKGLVVFLAHF